MNEKNKIGWVEKMIVIAICIILATIMFSRFTAEKARRKALETAKSQVK